MNTNMLLLIGRPVTNHTFKKTPYCTCISSSSGCGGGSRVAALVIHCLVLLFESICVIWISLLFLYFAPALHLITDHTSKNTHLIVCTLLYAPPLHAIPLRNYSTVWHYNSVALQPTGEPLHSFSACAMPKNHTQWCEELLRWRHDHDGTDPARTSEDAIETSLANWLEKAQRRMSRCIGSGPSKAKLSAAEQDELQKALAPFEKQAMVAASVDDASVSGEAATPDIMRIWQGQRLPGAQVFVKAVWEEFVTSTAAGEKFFECSNAKNMFRELGAGDLLLLVQTRSQQRVAAVAEVAHPA